MTYPTHPLIRVTPYPDGADVMPVRGEAAGWTAAIRGQTIRVFDATRQIATATPWWTLADGPGVLIEWCAMGAPMNQEEA